MGKLTIIGNDKPVIGKQEMYSVAAINGWQNPLQSIKNPLQVQKAHWEVMVQTKTGWRKGGSDKEGQMVPYIFGQKSLFHKGIKIIVRQGEDYGELIVHPQRAKEPKITRVELLDANYKPIPKGKKLSYKDTIIARAYCVEMFEMNIAFTLWEDDAQGEGHNPTINALNKINPVPVLSRVNEKGMAEAVFRLPFYTMAVLIANSRTASGDKNEGPTHEYYVTADVVSKHIQKASPNINVVNPTHNPEPPRKREVPKKQTPSPPKPKTTPAPEKPKPKPDGNSAKFPVTTGGKKSDDPQGKILSAEFVDGNGNRLHSSKVGTAVAVKITAKGMKNKKVKIKIWEEDNFSWTNDLIHEKDCVLVGDTSFVGVLLTKEMFDKAKEFGTDSARQDYFIEVIHNDTSVKSAIMPVSADATPTEVPSGNSATMVKESKQGKTPSSCICKEQYKDLIWGGKVSCEFRKKVVQICSELWGESRKMEMANGLMAVMKVETWGSFKAHHREGYKSANDNPKELTISSFHKESAKSSRAVGLIQFTQDALEGMGEFPKSTTATKGTQLRYDNLNKLKLSYAQMGEIKQLDKVKKYFEPAKNKIKTPEDIYLQVFAPDGVGKNDNYLLYSKGTDEYTNNRSVDKNDDGIQRKEILERYYDSKNEGGNYKAIDFSCGIDRNEKNDIKSTDIVTYHIYSTGIIEKFIPKKVKSGYENKYKYIYHDSTDKEHEICIVDWHKTKEKSVGQVYKTKPTHAKILEDKNVSEGNTSRRVKYINGDIAEYGSHPKKGIIWLLYSAGKNDVELVRMPDTLNYSNGDVRISYIFNKTQRKFTGANAFAGFIGYLARSGYKVTTSGSCFSEGSSFPSQEHCNGRSVDTFYLGNIIQDQKVIDSAIFFHFTEVLKGVNEYCKKLKRAGNGGTLHNSHLHSGNFNNSSIKIIKEK
ncbi:hypothetical protein DRF65_02890 [Chryseobacterium pennae]|uniref:Phage tail lysozyme domain-containing protein n=1 Tax=Chryseobacterium pennae TaxID=2258962 RepID=A0A3D9CD17_9FLAO|nr:hypothetical protein [Chryseobacterium pennae]REC63677.1 hypothetical protein DRF65_02890 [Chryseobacterium pennae]